MILDKISTKRKSKQMDACHYHFQLSAEFNQFYLQDEASQGEATWSIEEEFNKVALDAGLIAIGTECDRVVPVEIHISASEPLLDVEAWDHLVECTIDVPSGHLVVCGCVDDFATAARIKLDPGKYRARICYGNQYSREDHLDCADYYVVMLWPGSEESFEIVKKRVDIFYELIG